MGYEGVHEIVDCEFCDNKATRVWLKAGIFGFRFKMLCKKCATMFKRVRDDAHQ